MARSTTYETRKEKQIKRNAKFEILDKEDSPDDTLASAAEGKYTILT
jgi:hypothetical protein